jgi:hypothetical protein
MIRTKLAATAVAVALLSTVIPAASAAAAPPIAPASLVRASFAPAALAPGSLAPAPLPSAALASRSKTELTLAYMADAGYATAVVLRCSPVGGSHPKPVQACNLLTKAAGQPGRLVARMSMCMMLYAPITAEITGNWQGKKMKWSKKYGNTCEMTRATGILFTF